MGLGRLALRFSSRAIGPVLLTGLGACTSLFYVHDPQSGIISVGEVPAFLKAVRCELVTFYDLERRRKRAFENSRKIMSIAGRFSRYAYFEVEPTLYGTFTAELKVTDSAGVLAGATAFDFKQVLSATASATSQLAPTASTQSTYDLIYSFLLRQDASLTSIDSELDPLQRGCYQGPSLDLEDVELLAEGNGKYPATFKRIFVNGQKPLAAWLRDNSVVISGNYLGTSLKSDAAEPAQMTYTFTIQVIAGLETKYSLVATRFSPTVEASGGLQQNSNLVIYVNGPAAAAANTAKSGGASIKPVSAALGTKGNPMYVYPEATPKEPLDLRKDGKNTPPSRPEGGGGPNIRGYFLTPLTVVPPSATPNQ